MLLLCTLMSGSWNRNACLGIDATDATETGILNGHSHEAVNLIICDLALY